MQFRAPPKRLQRKHNARQPVNAERDAQSEVLTTADIRTSTIPIYGPISRQLSSFLPLSCMPLSAYAETMVTSHYNAKSPSIAAHRTLPMGTRLNVLNPRNGRTAQVVIGDRGPYINGRVLDISSVVARQLGFGTSGVLRLQTSVVRE
jgi:Lytic transglycolase